MPFDAEDHPAPVFAWVNNARVPFGGRAATSLSQWISQIEIRVDHSKRPTDGFPLNRIGGLSELPCR